MNKIIEESFDLIENKLINNKHFNSATYYKNKKTINFISVNFSNFNLKKRYKISNLKDHKTEIKFYDEFAIDGTIATYVGKTNTIFYQEEYLSNELIVHELIHMATHKSKEEQGFFIGIDEFNIEHLSEGITQYLTCKVIDQKECNNMNYSSQTRFAKMLEYIVGEEDLLHYFSNCNFIGLNKKYSLNYEESALVRLASDMEDFHKLIDLKLEYEITKKEAKKIDYQSMQLLSKIQKLLIELYTEHRLKHASKEEIKDFLNNLITIEVDNNKIKENLKPILKDKTTIHKTMNLKMRKALRE
jgi:hypothetical protein